MKKVGIYQQNWKQALHEQRFIGLIAQFLSESSEVELLHHLENFDLQEWGKKYGVDLSRVTERKLPSPVWEKLENASLKQIRDFCREFSEPYDVFLNASNEPPIFNHARHGVLLTQIPKRSFQQIYAYDSPAWKEQFFLTRFFRKRRNEIEWAGRFSSYQTFISNSNFSKQICWDRWKITPQVLNFPLSFVQPDQVKKKPLFLSVGSMTKGNPDRLDVIVHAFQDFFDRMVGRFNLQSDWELRIIGAGTNDSERDENFIEKLRLKALGYPIEIIPSVTPEELGRHLSEAGLYLQASGYGSGWQTGNFVENVPISLAEVQKFGVIPLVFHADGMAEAINHGMNGFLWTKYRELLEITTAILLEDRILPFLECNARENAKRFSDAAFRENLRTILKGILEIPEPVEEAAEAE